MKLTKEQFVKYMTEYDKLSEQELKISDDLNVVEWFGMDALNSFFDLIVDMCELRYDNLIGDYLVYWYFELNKGEKDDGSEEAIPKNFSDLYDYLVKYEQKELDEEK